MAELKQTLTQNVEGAFYVDSSCVDCDMCRTTAPNFFKRDEEIGSSIVYRQPKSAEEVALAELAIEECPTQSIGNDGLQEREQVATPAQPA
jgi:ferredoxin